MNEWQGTVLMVGIAFLSGSLPFGYWAGKLKGIDIREHGSGNIGATNVLRVMGKGVGIPVFILDMLKGLMPVLAAPVWMARFHTCPHCMAWVSVLCAAAAVLGHTFTPWLGFKGGKGVATSAGVLVGLAPIPLLVAISTWVIVFYTSRYVALASLAAAAILPVAMAAMMAWTHQWNGVLLGLGVVMGLFVIIRHRSNISRLLAGTENRFQPKTKTPP